MEYAHSVVLGLVITVSLAGAAIVYIGEYAQNMDEGYQVIARADVISSNGGSNGNNNNNNNNNSNDNNNGSIANGAPRLQIIVITYTNAGNQPLQFFEASVTDCASCLHAESTSVQAHASHTVSWIVKNEVLEGKIIDMRFTFEDMTVVIRTQRLQ